MKFIPKNFAIPELCNIVMEETKIKYFTLQNKGNSLYHYGI